MGKILINIGAFILSLTVFLAVLAVAPGSVSVSYGASPERISIAYCSDCVPFHFTDEDGLPAGMIIDLWRLWSEKTGIEIDFKAALWEETLKMVGSGSADAHAGLFYNKERDKYLDYGTTLTETTTHYFSNIILPPINTIKELAKYKVGVIAGDFVEEYLKDRLPEKNVVPYPDHNSLMNDLANGFLQVFAADTPTGMFHLKINGLDSYFTFVPEKPLYKSDWFVAVQEGNKALIEVINQGMTQISYGERLEVNRHWQGSTDIKGEALIISIDRSHAPFTFVDDIGDPAGLFVDIWRAWSHQTGKKIQFHISNLSETYEGLENGVADFHSGLSFSKEREKWLDFSSQIYEEYARVFHKVDDSQPVTIEEYGTDPIGVLLGSNLETKFKQTYPFLWVRSYLTNEELIKALLKGEIKAVIQEETRMEAMLALQGQRSNITSRSERLFPNSIHAGVIKEKAGLIQEINKGLALIPKDKLADIEKRWIPNPDHRFYQAHSELVKFSPDEEAFLKGHPVLRVAFDVDWPPIEYSDKEFGMNGMAVDYLKRMSEFLGVEFEPSRPRPWKEMVGAVENGELDFFSAISPTPQRRKWIGFTDSYLSIPIVIFTGKEVPYIASMSDLRDKPVAVVDGYASHDLLLENNPNLTLLPVQDVKEGLMTVSTGQAFAFVGSLATVSHVMSREGLTNLKVSGKTPYSFDISMGTHRDNTVLLKILGKALAAISPQERNTINSRWTSVIFQHETDYSLIWRILAGALIILAIVLYWIGRLQKEISERKRAEKAAEKANQGKSAFLANMSHELRTPLNAILGFSELMSRDRHLSPEHIGNLKTIGRSGEHLLSLINDGLEFSKIEADRIVLNQENFDLHRLLLGLEEMFRLHAQQEGLSLNFERASDVPQYIRTDQHKLRQILINLLGNAVKFTAAGGISISVTCSGPNKEVQTGICSLHIEVADTGVGIAKDEQGKIFEAFFQSGDQPSSQQGTGLGLPISLKFADLMGGVLAVNSEVGKGSSFTFDIPVELADGSDSVPSRFTSRVIGLAAEQPVFRLLVVEDNDNSRNLLVTLLQTVGFEVQEAVNGQEAIGIWQKWQPHLIWMDMRMPVMNGYEATKQIKAAPAGKDTVIIAVTASAFEKDRRKFIEHGGNDFVRKPFREAEIFEMIHKHLGVQYVYEEDVGIKSAVNNTMMSDENLTASIKDLPLEVIARLKEATELGDATMIDQVIDDIRIENVKLADGLSSLAENFAHDEILALVQKTQEKSAGEPQ